MFSGKVERGLSIIGIYRCFYLERYVPIYLYLDVKLSKINWLGTPYQKGLSGGYRIGTETVTNDFCGLYGRKRIFNKAQWQIWREDIIYIGTEPGVQHKGYRYIKNYTSSSRLEMHKILRGTNSLGERNKWIQHGMQDFPKRTRLKDRGIVQLALKVS